MTKLSCIIPSYKDPYLHPTIDDLLAKSELGDDIEIIVILDGYWPEKPIRKDKRIKIIHSGQNSGMRETINKGVRLATGEYLMRVDEHQMFGQGYDRIILETIEDNWIVTPSRHELDPVNWKIMSERPKNFCKLMITEDECKRKFTSVTWRSMDKKMENVMIGETMAMQGSCWFMKKSWWDKVIGELSSEGYGTHYQDSIEMVFKTWQAGGKLMLNKNTWHAHKHRSFNRTHNYGGELARASFKHAIDTWQPYYEEVIRPRFGI